MITKTIKPELVAPLLYHMDAAFDKHYEVVDSSGVPTKEKLQKFIFPGGVTYNREKGAFLTSKVNMLFRRI